MEILEILKNSKEEIYLEDLEFFETELATGEYLKSYVAECKEQIRLVRKWICEKEEVDKPQPEKEKLPKKGNAQPITAKMSPKDIIFSDIKIMRESDNYKSKFKKYVQEKAEIDSTFVDANYAFFLQWELDAIISVKQVGEKFLEKYFGALDKDKISRHQCFSESFFMKHYAQLDAAIVLTKGKNEWRKKEKRSKQLDVFLRLKGVKL